MIGRFEPRMEIMPVAQSTVIQDEKNALSMLVPSSVSESDHVKVSLFGAITFGRVGGTQMTQIFRIFAGRSKE